MTTRESAITQGLDEAEATARAERGLRNVLSPATGRTYLEILRENVFTFINITILGLGVALAVLGEPSDALVSIGVVAVNVAVAVVQEIRAKVVLDRIALLVRPTVRVIRGGLERELPPAEIVVGDVVRLEAGDQVVADGTIVAGGPLKMDESPLTGESAPVARIAGDALRSGTFCVAGSAIVETTLVGDAAYANRLTAGARSFRRVSTPLQRRVDAIVRAVLVVAVSFGLVLAGSWFVERGSVLEGVQMAMVIAGLVPNGLLLAASVAYALSAVRIAQDGVLVQQANAIDSLSHVDVLCMDKTGTLTAGRVRLAALDPLRDGADLRALAGAFAASATSRDATLDAIRAAAPAAPSVPLREVAFSAARRWSAVEIDGIGPLVLGAPEALLPYATNAVAAATSAVETRTADGLRVLLLARSGGLGADAPGPLEILGLVGLAEELRPGARETIERFAGAGIRIVLISGDHPNTLRAVARAAGLDARRVMTGEEVAGLDDGALREAVRSTALFARTAPEQKERIVRAIRADGRYTAMAGDGINDVLALKSADLGISLRAGAASARAVADIVLLRDEIAALIPAAREGRRISRGMRDILRIFLTRVGYAALLIASLAVIDGAFPYTPTQNALLTLLTVGIPSLALAALAPAAAVRTDDRGEDLARMVVPAAWTIAALGFATYVGTLVAHGSSADARSALTTFSVLTGLLFFVLVADDAGGRGRAVRADPRRALLAALLLAGYGALLTSPAARALFDLAEPGPAALSVLAATAVAWLLVLRWLLRARALDRVLGLRS